jgi:hypothetical protein
MANHQHPKDLRILAFRPLNEKLKNKNLSALSVSAVNIVELINFLKNHNDAFNTASLIAY